MKLLNRTICNTHTYKGRIHHCYIVYSRSEGTGERKLSHGRSLWSLSQLLLMLLYYPNLQFTICPQLLPFLLIFLCELILKPSSNNLFCIYLGDDKNYAMGAKYATLLNCVNPLTCTDTSKACLE